MITSLLQRFDFRQMQSLIILQANIFLTIKRFVDEAADSVINFFKLYFLLQMRDWEKRSDEPWKRKYNFIPQKHKRLLDVPAYDNYIKERFERCLDLYLCPRAKKMRVRIRSDVIH